MTSAIQDAQNVLGLAFNSKNNGGKGDSSATPDAIKFHLVCARSFFLGQTSMPWSFVNMTLMSLIFA